jgi:hypothetical protein
MRKEVIIAILIGFGLGLVITFGIWTANRALQEAPGEETSTTAPVEETTPTSAFSLTINQPEDNSISAEEEITLSGSTRPGGVVVVLYEEGEKILEANEEGEFETEITLVGGSNEIKVSAYDNEGNEVGQTLTIVYSTAEI